MPLIGSQLINSIRNGFCSEQYLFFAVAANDDSLRAFSSRMTLLIAGSTCSLEDTWIRAVHLAVTFLAAVEASAHFSRFGAVAGKMTI